MNKRILLVTTCALLLTSALLAGCAGTKTITQVITEPGATVTAPGATIPVTIIQTFGTGTAQVQTSVVMLTGPAPKIPHAATVEGLYGFCFNCHPIPAGHTGRIANQDLCMDCHEQGPYLLEP